MSTTTPAAGPRFHHVGLPVSDLEASIAWYEAALGFAHELTAQVPEGVRIAFVVNEAGEKVELFELPTDAPAWDGPITALRAGVGHVGFTVSDLEASFERAAAAGGRVVWEPRPSPRPGQRIAFLADPDGNLIELLAAG
jgi:glyoxylase I family protein